jgi:hypothetical protein
MKGFIFLMFISLFNFSFAGDLTQGGGGGTKEPTIIRGSMVMEKSNGMGIELRSGHLIELNGEKSMNTNRPFREISKINESGSRFDAGGDGSGGG